VRKYWIGSLPHRPDNWPRSMAMWHHHMICPRAFLKVWNWWWWKFSGDTTDFKNGISKSPLRDFFEFIQKSLKLRAKLAKAPENGFFGRRSSPILGSPIFRGELFVSGSVPCIESFVYHPALGEMIHLSFHIGNDARRRDGRGGSYQMSSSLGVDHPAIWCGNWKYLCAIGNSVLVKWGL